VVTRLVLVEAGPAGPDEDTATGIDNWLRGWPVPFPDRTVAAEFLGGGPVGAAWAGGLRQRADGWYPAFDRDVMVTTIAAATGPQWDEFERINCPILVVRGERGFMPTDEYDRIRRHPLVTSVEVPGAGHDLHLDSPDQWRAALTGFLADPVRGVTTGEPAGRPQPAALRTIHSSSPPAASGRSGACDVSTSWTWSSGRIRAGS
jgi:pimeloyl-ACP methyl ester carboxylesterase